MTTPDVFLYHLALQPPGSVTCAVYGNFSGPKAQEIVVARGKLLQLLRPDETGNVHVVATADVFGVLRAVATFRMHGSNTDQLVLASDAGSIALVTWDEQRRRFTRLHLETFGKTGVRRLVPGQYLAVDPKGRAVMIGAVEKQKLVYILNRDGVGNVTISSPLEAHRSFTFTYAMAALDVGFDNPMFAAIECQVGDIASRLDTSRAPGDAPPHRQLVVYELDLGLNHVVRKWSERIDDTAHALMTVPGGGDGPGGVLICAEDKVMYKHIDHPLLETPIPRRASLLASQRTLIVACARHKQRRVFFFLLQSEYGDLFKVTLQLSDDGSVRNVVVSYFDTVAVASSLCVLKAGFLFVAAEFGDHALYQFASMGDDNEAGTCDSFTEFTDAAPFPPRRQPQHLVLIDQQPSLAPIMDCTVGDLARESTLQLYAMCGRGTSSSLRVLRYGLPVTELAVTPLPGTPTAVWGVRGGSGVAAPHRFIVVSFVDATLVLDVGDEIKEAFDSGFLTSVPTLAAGALGTDTAVQVHASGVRHIRADARVSEWKASGMRTIVQASVNERQVAVALTGGQILYFELDVSGALIEVARKDLGHEVACLDLGDVPAGRVASRFLAVGGWNSTVRVLDLDHDDCLATLAVQALSDVPSSVCLARLLDTGAAAALSLHVGLRSGVLLRTQVDAVSGQLQDARERFLGPRPVQLRRVLARGTAAVVCLTTRPWLAFAHGSAVQLVPLSYTAQDDVAAFTSAACPEGLISVSAGTMRILVLERLDSLFHQTSVPLDMTPRRALLYPRSSWLFLLETDHNARPVPTTEGGVGDDSMALDDEETGAGVAVKQRLLSAEEVADLRETRRVLGCERPGPGTWASQIRAVDAGAAEPATLAIEQLPAERAAVAIATVAFASAPNQMYLAVGGMIGLDLETNKAPRGGFIRIYSIADETGRLVLWHETPTESPVTSLTPFQGRLLAGLTGVLRMYEMGKKRLLRKCELRDLPTQIVWLTTMGPRIYLGDARESIMMARYRRHDGKLYVVADDMCPRWLTCATLVDYDTVAAADKFGNVVVLRLPRTASDDVDDSQGASTSASHAGLTVDAPPVHKLGMIACFHLGDTVMSLRRAALVAGGADVLLYTTVSGAIGALLPLTSRDDIDFFQNLELRLRKERLSLIGRDHMAWRSSYAPVKCVADGELCELFNSLDEATRASIAQELGKEPSQVQRKMEEVRNRVL